MMCGCHVVALHLKHVGRLYKPAATTAHKLILFGRDPAAERVAAELAKDTAAVQLLQGRPGATISSGDVRPMESAAVNGMRKRAVLFMDAAQQPWTVLHANDLLAEVSYKQAARADVRLVLGQHWVNMQILCQLRVHDLQDSTAS